MNTIKTQGGERLNNRIESGASIAKNCKQPEQMDVHGRYTITCTRPAPEYEEQYRKLRDTKTSLSSNRFLRALFGTYISHLTEQMAAIPKIQKWEESFDNLVTTVGKNHNLDTWLSGSSYTAAWYLGLISSVSWSAVAAGDTMSSHAGWTEYTAYSESVRQTPSWASAASGSKATSAAVAYSCNAAGTVKGAFLNTVSTKSGTTGTLGSAGTFSGGDQVVADLDTLNVTYTLSA